MPAEPFRFALSDSQFYGFLCTLARLSGIFVFLPIPGMKNAPTAPRLVLAVIFSAVMLPLWPVLSGDPSQGEVLLILLGEAAFGLAAGLTVSFIEEAFLVGAQALGVQAGYSYASSIDPNTQADSGVLQIFMTLFCSVLFFAAGLDRQLIRVFAGSLQSVPPGAFLKLSSVQPVLNLGTQVFTVGLRLALPVIALLLLVDISLALLARINSQLQMLSLAFPAKMLAGLLVLASLTAVVPRLYETMATGCFEVLGQLAGGIRR